MAMHEVTEYELTYIESIYKLANSNMDCTGAVEVIKFQEGLFINFRKDLKTHRMDTKVQEVQENFIEPFMSKVQSLEKTCSFVSLAVNFNIEQKTSHANIVLILKNKKHIKFLLYEPHGADGNKSEDEKTMLSMQELFSTFLIDIFRQNGFTAERMSPVLVSCPKGIQRYMKDNIGYCSTISSLWIYIVLMIMKKTTDKFRLFNNLDIVEKCFYRLNDNKPEKVYDMVVNFTRYFIENFYSEHMIPDCKDVKRKLKPLILPTTQPGFSKTNFERFIGYLKKNLTN
jgi:hypothetical protein